VMLLEDLGYTVMPAATPAEALATLKTFSADMVFSDLLMPGGMSAAQFVTQLQTLYPDIAILMTTGDPSALRSFDRGDIAVLQKPYTLDTLSQAVRRTLDKRRKPPLTTAAGR
jgi:DNA-binding NtrC family response regulator